MMPRLSCEVNPSLPPQLVYYLIRPDQEEGKHTLMFRYTGETSLKQTLYILLRLKLSFIYLALKILRAMLMTLVVHLSLDSSTQWYREWLIPLGSNG